MGNAITLESADGHKLTAWKETPESPPRGSLVVIQEIFGVNAHIRDVAHGFAAQGYTVLAPALFDRVERDVDLPYDATGFARGRELRAALGWEAALRDLEAAVKELQGETNAPPAVVGYCWGGSLAWLSACRLGISPGISCAVAYYGAQIIDFLEETPRAPVMMHFGEKDDLIPPETVDAIKGAKTGAEIFTYPAGHGFNCDMRNDFDAGSSKLARERTLAFLAKHLKN